MALDPLVKKVRRAARLALNEIGRKYRDYVRDKISVWVVYQDGYVERSEPGEPPRREFSVLWKSVKYKRNPGGHTWADVDIYISEDVFFDNNKDPYAWYLEFGTSHIEPRPFWHVSRREIRPHLKDWFAREFYAKLGKLNAGDRISGDSSVEMPE